MDLETIGRQVAAQRRAQGLTLQELAAQAAVGRSTLAALETGKLHELGFAKVARVCAALGLKLRAQAPELDTPLMAHRHLTEAAGRELTKAAIEDIIIRGDIRAWRGLARSLRDDKSGRLARRVRSLAAAISQHDPKARAFAALLPELLPRSATKHG
jgi:transcriptional regulator with XRE-family HTH domain